VNCFSKYFMFCRLLRKWSWGIWSLCWFTLLWVYSK